MKHVKELAEIIVEQGRFIEDLDQDFKTVLKQRDDLLRSEKVTAEKFYEAEQSIARLQESNNALAADNNKRQEIEQMLNSSLDKLVQQNAELTNRFQALQQGNVDLSNKVAELELKASDSKLELQWMTRDRDYLSEIINGVVAKLSDPTNTSGNREIIEMLQPKGPQCNSQALKQL